MGLQRSTSDWVSAWRDGRYWWDRETLAREHNMLHAQFGGDASNQAIVEIEQEMSSALRGNGLEHRHADQLAQKAGTIIDEPAPATVDEVQAYLSSIVLDSRAVELVQDVDGGPIYMVAKSPFLTGVESSLLKALNRYLPPGLTLKMLGRSAKGTFAKSVAPFELKLGQRYYSEPIITTWDVVVAHLRVEAAKASKVFKEDRNPSIPFTIVKGSVSEEAEERRVTGVVLIPNVVDKTVANPDGTPTGAEGDIYSDEDVRDAMYWWMEQADQRFVYNHAVHGGLILSKQDVKILECWIARSDYKEGEQDIPKGTWMMTTRVNHDGLWTDIVKGNIKSWSIGAEALGAIEEIEAE